MYEVRLSMAEMEPQLGDSFKVCGFCSQLTEQADSLSPDMMTFMAQFLNLPVVRLPAKLCPECLKRSVSARKFSEKCRRAIEKLEKNGLTGGMVWGKSESEVLKASLSTGGGVEYNWRRHGPLKFPRITITAEERDRAEDFLARRRSGCDPGDSEEIFPAEGPFECEMCHEVTITKQDFVDHIKDNHRDFIDPQVLSDLESDLQKKRTKVVKKPETSKDFMKKTEEPLRVNNTEEGCKKPDSKSETMKKKSTTSSKRKQIVESDSDEDYRGSAKKVNYASHASYSELQYIDEEGNPLPKSAGKFRGLCNVCGKVLGRANEMFKHQQTINCQAVAKSKGIVNGNIKDNVMVVVVTNYKGSKSKMKSESPGPKPEDDIRDPDEEDVVERDRSVEEANKCVEKWVTGERDVKSKQSESESLSSLSTGAQRAKDLNCYRSLEEKLSTEDQKEDTEVNSNYMEVVEKTDVTGNEVVEEEKSVTTTAVREARFESLERSEEAEKKCALVNSEESKLRQSSCEAQVKYVEKSQSVKINDEKVSNIAKLEGSISVKSSKEDEDEVDDAVEVTGDETEADTRAGQETSVIVKARLND